MDKEALVAQDLDKYRSGSTEPWTTNILAALVAAKRPMVLLETGTYKGYTTLALRDAAPYGSVLHTLDSLEAGGDVTMVSQEAGIQFHATDALQWLRRYNGPPIEFAFIDDDHTPRHVSEELEALKPKMAKGGLICLHDVFGEIPEIGLKGVVAAHGGYCIELPRLHLMGGLGFIQIPGEK